MMDVTDEQFEKYLEEAWKKIPEHFKVELENVSIRIEHSPNAGQLERAKAKGHTLLGLFEGLAKPQWGQATFGEQPSKISIFQDPIVKNARTEDELENLVQEVLMHEVAHYFGYNDEEMCVLDDQLRHKLREQKDHSNE